MIAVTSTKARTKSIRSTTTTTTPTIATTLAATMSHIALQVLTVNVLLLLLLVALRPPTARALPITSKPIEGTAEHLAWQAWLMLPPEQKELEKSRKVTPKSIFTLPFRDCPPGHQLFQSRCIPTVNINQSELLTQQVLGFIVGNGGGGGTNSGDAQYEFDYDDEELGMSVGEEQQVLVYDAAQRFHAAAADETPSNYDARDVAPVAQSPPNKDEPLKFNLFQQQHFSTNDYEADSAGVEGSGSAAKPPPLPLERGVPLQSVHNATQFLSAVHGLLHRPSNASNGTATYNNYNNSTSKSQNHTVGDLQSESSNISANFVAHTTTTTTTTGVVSAPLAHSFAFSEIDAIALPAAGADTDAATASLGGDLETQRVSLFKDDSAVQLVTTVIADADVAPTATATTTTAKVQQPLSVAQMLRAEALLPLKNAASAAQIATATTTTTATFAALDCDDTAMAPQSLDDDGISLDYLLGVAGDSTTTTTTTMHSSLHELAAAAGQHAGERPRSVVADIDGADTEAQELHFSTTEESEGTTNFQIDETTVIETQQPRAVANDAADLLAIVQQRAPDAEPDQLHVVLKKSKVEPVGEVSTTATAATMPSATATTTQSAAAIAAASLATPLPSAMAMAAAAAVRSAADDRFGGEVVDANAALSVAGRRRGSSFASANSNNNADSRNKASLMAASEMNIEQELRMINELVKGKRRQLAKTPTASTTTTITTTATATATTPTTTANGETTTTTAAETAASATAKNTVTTTNSATGSKVAPLTAETTTTKISKEAKTSETTTTTAAATTVTAASALNRVVANEKETTTTTTTTTSKNAPTKAKALLESGQRVGVAAKTTTTTTTTATTTTATTPTAKPTTTTTTATEPSSTIWSKIMPIFGWATTTTTATKVEEVPTITTTVKEASTDSDTTTKTSLDAVETTTDRKAAAESSSARAPKLNASSPSPHRATSASLSSQRNHRNSKIINVNHLDANSVSDSDATTTTTATRTQTTATKNATADAIDIDAPDEVTDDPFWWLPMGWRLDRPNTHDDQNLLMRFWSSFPESSTKARS